LLLKDGEDELEDERGSDEEGLCDDYDNKVQGGDKVVGRAINSLYKRYSLSALRMVKKVKGGDDGDKEGMFKVSSIKKNDTIIFKGGNDYVTYTYVATKSNPKDLQEIELEVKTIEERLGLDFNVAVPEPEYSQDDEKIYGAPEVPALFPGGPEKMNLYLSKMIQRPTEVHDELHFLKSYVQIVVEKDGMLSNIQIVKGAFNCPECDKEALRVVKSMPKFHPAMNNGRAVRSNFVFPVKFDFD
jgi:protein TonB